MKPWKNMDLKYNKVKTKSTCRKEGVLKIKKLIS